MRLYLKEIQRHEGPVEQEATLEFPQIAAESKQVASIEAVSVAIQTVFEDGLFRVRGNAKTNVTYECSRCLDTFVSPLNAKIDESFTNVESAATEDVIFVPEDTVLFTPFVEQAVILELAYQPLCSESCAGLCPECGVNRNVEPCNCAENVVDPRLEGLKDLLSSDDLK